MSYKTFEDQCFEHIRFLRNSGLDVGDLKIGTDFVRCHPLGQAKEGRGECFYKTFKNPMDKPGVVGLVTICRIPGGEELKYKTYGFNDDGTSSSIFFRPFLEPSTSTTLNADDPLYEKHEEAASKAYGFWKNSDIHGRSDYLDRKGVGSYGIRFRSNEKYGRVAIVPMRDEGDKLWSYQCLNSDGTKRFLKDGRTKGLFHILKQPTNGEILGISESYVTGATCMELTSIPVSCAFSSDNLLSVALSLRKLYPLSPIVVFADNDRHHENNTNKGLACADKVKATLKDNIYIAYPDCGDLSPSRDSSDWNDLVRLKGHDVAKQQLEKFLPKR